MTLSNPLSWNYGESDTLENFRQRTLEGECSPAAHAANFSDEVLTGVWKAYRNDPRTEAHRLIEFENCEIVVEVSFVEVLVNRDSPNRDRLNVVFRDFMLSQSSRQLTEDRFRNAVSCGEDVPFRNEHL